MTLQSSGALSFSQMQTEFGGSSPISMTEYYGEGTIPSSGTIKVSDFYGQSSGFVLQGNVTFFTGTIGSITHTKPSAFSASSYYGSVGYFPNNWYASNGTQLRGLVGDVSTGGIMGLEVSATLPNFRLTNVSNGQSKVRSQFVYINGSPKQYNAQNFSLGFSVGNRTIKYEEI